MIATFFYLIGESLKGLWRTRTQSFASILMIMLSISLLLSGFFAYINFNRYSDELKTSYQVEVFFETKLDSIECRDSFNSIYSLAFIKEGEYISKKKAAKIFNNQFGQKISHVFGSNPLPCSGRYDVVESYRNINGLNEIRNEISILQGVEDVHYPSNFIIKFDSLSSDLIAGFTISGLIFFFISLFIVSNTIRLVIFARKSQVNILILLGASNTFIRMPLVMEGLIQGITGGLLASGVSILIKAVLTYLFYPVVDLHLIGNPEILIISVVLGVLFGLIGSLIGMGRYLQKR
jgi:cell division transport system permease protein